MMVAMTAPDDRQGDPSASGPRTGRNRQVLPNALGLVAMICLVASQLLRLQSRGGIDTVGIILIVAGCVIAAINLVLLVRNLRRR